MSDEHGERRQLARGMVAQVECCMDCGVFHLSMESLTVRFDFAALRDLSETLCAALASHRELLRTAGQSMPEPQRVDPKVH